MKIPFTLLITVLFIVSCSSPDDSIDITPNSNNQQTNNPINDGNNNDGSNNDGNNNDGNNNDGNNNDGSNNDGNNNDGNNNDGNNDEINSLFFDKWNFSSNSSKNDFKSNLVDFIILRSNNEYILNLNGKEDRGQFIYSNNTIELINNGIITSISINENQFTFELDLFNGQSLNKTAYSDKYYTDGDCTSFLECTNRKTFSIASDYMYAILNTIYQGEFFYFQFSNEPTGEWIQVWNNRKYLKIGELIDAGLINSYNDLNDVDYTLVTYASSILNDENEGYFNPDCERDWSKWSNKILAYENPFIDGFYNTQYTTLVENSFRAVRFSYNDNLGREIFMFRFTYNPDLSVTLEQQFSPDSRLNMTFIEREIDTSVVDSNFCVNDVGRGEEPYSDIHFGEVPSSVDDWLDDDYFYSMFTWWAMFLCEVNLCLNLTETTISE